MKVLTIEPVSFASGDILTPDELNACFLYAKDALIDVSGKRWAKGLLVLPFCADLGTPYTESMDTEERTYRFICPVTCVVERGFLNANMTSSAEVTVKITAASGGATPSGCTVPWLTTGAAVASATDDTTDINVDKFVLDAGVEYKITVASSGTFTLNRFDVILHVATDRWNTAGTVSVPSFEPALLTDASGGALAANVTVNQASLTTETNKLAANLTAPVPMLIARHGLLSSTDADQVEFVIPRFGTGRAQANITRIYLFAYMASTAGGTVTATLKDESGVTVATVTANVAGVTQKTADSGALAISLVGGPSADKSQDYTLTFANSSGAVDAIKVYALVWMSR